MRVGHHVVPPLAPRSGLTLDEAGLTRWGEELGAASKAPLVVALTGDLGAGKTTLAQAICRGYGVSDPVTSPTYAIVQQYTSPKSAVYHIDLYRLEDSSQLTNIGWDDITSDRALVIVEWPERAGDRMPADPLHIELAYVADDATKRLLLAG
ncbi:MAG: tRNA (adenosine(37)-N6)-threonylcarbamoyltransferase complex ATPase subunit type 1 TsaE [Gemmatimonadaceae bacterium]